MMTRRQVDLLEVDVQSDLYEKRHPEDGSIRYLESYYVTVTNPDGRRWAHFQCFNQGSDRDAKQRAEALAKRIEGARDSGTWKGPDNKYWMETQPAYGSEAYAKNATEYEYETELTEREAELGPRAALESMSNWGMR